MDCVLWIVMKSLFQLDALKSERCSEWVLIKFSRLFTDDASASKYTGMNNTQCNAHINKMWLLRLQPNLCPSDVFPLIHLWIRRIIAGECAVLVKYFLSGLFVYVCIVQHWSLLNLPSLQWEDQRDKYRPQLPKIVSVLQYTAKYM